MSYRKASLLAAVVAAALVATASFLPPTRHAATAADQPAPPAPQPAGVVRVAAVGGINDGNFWKELSARFERATGLKVDTVLTGNKDGAADLFRQGGIDLITMQPADTVVDLVAGGWAADPQPWAQSDFALVGPENDPAGARGSPDLPAALRKIAAAKAPLVVHDSGGAGDVLRETAKANGIDLQSDATMFLLDDHQRRVLTVAQERKAYTLIARVPFRSGKLLAAGLSVLVAGDARLRRPYLLAVADPARITGARVTEARRLAAFLRSPETQAWIAGFGKQNAGDLPLFFPVTVGGAPEPAKQPTTRPAAAILTVGGTVAKPLALDADAFAALPHKDVRVKGRDGQEVVYSAVPLATVLAAAGVQTDVRMDPKADPKSKNANLRLAALVEGADGYAVAFSLAELSPDAGRREAWLASAADGKPLGGRDGPIRLIVPEDAKPARSVRAVAAVTIVDVAEARKSAP